MDKKYPLVSVITVNYNGKHFLKGCFDSLLMLNYPQSKLEIIMVDNGSTDGSVEYVKDKFPKVKILKNEVNNYCRANNLGIKIAKGEFIALINNDVKVDKDWLMVLIKTSQSDKSIGAVGSKILFMDGSIQSVGHQEYPNFYWGDIGFREEDKGQYNVEREVTSICGCSVLYRKKCLKDVGLLDEDFNIYIEDVDMAIRCRNKRWKLLTCPDSVIQHEYHGTVKNDDNSFFWVETNRLLLIAKHWPEKLAEVLSGRDYFTVKNGYNSDRDISSVLGKVFGKLIKEHGWEFTNKLSGDLFNAVRRIYNFEKNYLIQVIKDQDLSNSLKDRQIADLKQNLDLFKKEQEQVIIAKNQERFLKEQELVSRDRQIAELKQATELLKQQKEQELVSRDRQIADLKQATELLKQQKEQEIVARSQEAAALSGKVEVLNRELANLNHALADKASQLQGIYNSTGYRYILKPLWNVIFPIKKKIIMIRNLILFLRSKFRSVCKETYKVFRQTAKIAFGIARSLPLLFSNITLRNIYINHLRYNTSPLLPKKLVLMITRQCNLQCSFCDIAQVAGRKKLLDKAEAFKIIDAVSSFGIEELVLTGGEPLLHPDFFDIVDYANTKDIKVVVTTNGTLIKGKIERLKASKFSVISVSIDGKEATHDTLRNKSGVYRQALEAIKLLRDNKINTSVNFVVTNKNIAELEEVYDYFSGMGIKISFLPVINKPNFFPATCKEKDIFLAFIKKLLHRRRISIHDYRYLIASIEFHHNKKDQWCRCLGLNREFGIDTDGTISPCCVWENRKDELNNLGNIIEGNIDELWYSPRFHRARLSIFKQGCLNCFNPSIIDIASEMGIGFLVPDAGSTRKNKDSKAVAITKNLKKPNHVHMRFTNRCNLTCRHCNIWEKESSAQKELSLEEWKAGIDKLYNWLGSFKLDLAGGEILLYKGAISLIQHCASKGVSINLTTNATLIDEEMAKKIANSGLYCINLSLDGLAEVHGYTRNNPGVFLKVRQAADRILKYRVRETPYVSITTVITRYNLDQLLEIIQIPREWGINNSNFQALDNNFGTLYKIDWFKGNEFWPADYALVEKAIDGLIAAKRAGIRIDNSFDQLSDIKRYYKNPQEHINGIQCQSGMNNFIVDERGQVLLCWNMPAVGDIFNGEPEQIWNSKQANLMRKQIERCKRTCRMLNCNYA